MFHSFVTAWTVAHKTPLSLEFPRQENWSVLPFPLQGIFLTQELSLCVLHWQVCSLLQRHQGSPNSIHIVTRTIFLALYFWGRGGMNMLLYNCNSVWEMLCEVNAMVMSINGKWESTVRKKCFLRKLLKVGRKTGVYFWERMCWDNRKPFFLKYWEIH